MSVTYRQLAAGDVSLMRELLGVFAAAFNERATYLDAQPGDEYLRSLLSGPQFVTVVALSGGQVVGGLAAYELAKFEQARSEIYIYDLAVDERHRQQGIATGLIRELQQIAAARGAWVIYVQADLADTPAIELYTSLGVREDVLHFDIPVSRRG